MSGLSILCATSVAGGEEAFSTLGRVRLLPEAAINRDALRGADVLITRSKVNVNDALLVGSTLKFYGTATAGVDHVDAGALERRGIAWSAAPGSNAASVAEYVIAALAGLGLKRGLSWRGKTLAIIGAGHVGSCLARLAPALGLQVRLNDPPRREATGDPRCESRRDVLAQADIVSLHVPLTSSGRHPTRAMVDESFLAELQPGAVFINTSRGEVVADESLLLRARRDGRLSALLLDVFLHEPAIDDATWRGADLATPHIAGYSLEARWQGTAMVYEAACRALGLAPRWHIPAPGIRPTLYAGAGTDQESALWALIRQAYDPFCDDAALRSVPPDTTMAAHFVHMRQTYPPRRAFHQHRANIQSEAAAALGFESVASRINQ